MDFEWDPKKARANYSKHGVDFAFAIRVFDDLDALSTFDDSDGEERETIVGRIGTYSCRRFTVRKGRRRIITARKATRDEEKTYYEQFEQEQ